MNSNELGSETVEITQHVEEAPAKRGQKHSSNNMENNLYCILSCDLFAIKTEYMNSKSREIHATI